MTKLAGSLSPGLSSSSLFSAIFSMRCSRIYCFFMSLAETCVLSPNLYWYPFEVSVC